MHQEQTTAAAACAPASAVTFEMDVELGEGHGPDRRPGACRRAAARARPEEHLTRPVRFHREDAARPLMSDSVQFSQAVTENVHVAVSLALAHRKAPGNTRERVWRVG